MRHTRKTWVRFVLTAMVALSMAAPAMIRPPEALAQTVVTTTSTVDASGFITVVDETRSGTLLVERRVRTMTPVGFVLVDRTEQFWPNGLLRSVNDVRNGASLTNTVRQSYDQNGIIRAQYAETSWVGGVLAQKWTAFDAAGAVVANEGRTLTTQADGTQVWNVTVETFSNGLLFSIQTTQQPASVPLAPPTWFADAVASTVPPAPPAGGAGVGTPPNGAPPNPGAAGQGDDDDEDEAEDDEDEDEDEDEDDDDEDDDDEDHGHRGHGHNHGHGEHEDDD